MHIPADVFSFGMLMWQLFTDYDLQTVPLTIWSRCGTLDEHMCACLQVLLGPLDALQYEFEVGAQVSRCPNTGPAHLLRTQVCPCVFIAAAAIAPDHFERAQGDAAIHGWCWLPCMLQAWRLRHHAVVCV